MPKRLSSLVLATFALAGFSLTFSIGSAAPPAAQSQKVSGFALKDISGQTVSLANYQDKKAVVVFFIGTECRINNAYTPTFAALYREYTPKGVQFLAINSNKQDSLAKVKAHAKKYGLPFPVAKDDGNVVADLFGATRTPEAFILDPTGIVLYKGRVDDQFGIGYQKFQPTQRDLALALDEVLSGKPVSREMTPIAGCVIGRVSKTKLTGTVTFGKQVARIFQNRCQECHREGQIGPMPLVDFEDATAWAETIREVLTDGRMPPWYADARSASFPTTEAFPRKNETRF